MGKLKQSLPHGISPDNDLFLAMFLIRLPPSMQEAVASGNHKMTATMIKAADTLWDARGGHDPTVAAATTHRNSSPAPSGGSGAIIGPVLPVQKVAPLPTKIFSVFKTPAMAGASITITTIQEPTGV
jgi:hypothetical protein